MWLVTASNILPLQLHNHPSHLHFAVSEARNWRHWMSRSLSQGHILVDSELKSIGHLCARSPTWAHPWWWWLKDRNRFWLCTIVWLYAFVKHQIKLHFFICEYWLGTFDTNLTQGKQIKQIYNYTTMRCAKTQICKTSIVYKHVATNNLKKIGIWKCY